MEEDFADFEARMYAQVYHDNSVEPTPEPSDNLPHNLNKQSNKRYWQRSKNLSTTQRENFFQDQQPEPTIYTPERQQPSPQPKTPITPKAQVILTEDSTAKPTVKTFVPYSSILSFMESPKEPAAKPNNYEKKKNKPAKFPKASTGKLLNPLSKQGVTKGKSAMRLEIQQKKQKAALARKKAQSRIVTTIELEDSDESDCIPVELPPPPLISLDSSDDEETIKKKRALSPSSSSIISDDFIVAGDKRRLANPFKSDEMKNATEKLRKIVQQKEALEKVKALTKASSTSSSDSARSSVERNAVAEKSPAEQKKATSDNPRKSRKSLRISLDNSNEDSIYGAKAKPTKQSKDQVSDSSEDETLCVNAKNQKMRRRKSTSSRKKSTDCDQSSDKEDEGDPRSKLIASTPLAKSKKRSRISTGTYDEDEFANMISTILRNDESMEDDEESAEAVKEPALDYISIVDSTIEKVPSQEIDCIIVEQPVEVVNVPDDDEPVVSDSDDSLRGVKIPIDCDLSLNVTQVPYDPHEYIRNGGGGESSRELSSVSNDEVNPEIGWNEEMKFFYDGSWGAEHFCVSDLFEAMPRDPKLWRINNNDRNRTQDSGSRMRCRKCNEVGHMANRCTRPKKRIVCFMCGDEGHRETRCPNSICLRCGKPNRLFATICTSCHKHSKKYCPLCNYQGHDIEMCPDKWRRYHSTTTDSNELSNDYHVNPRVYCSICARRGHFAENCNQFLKTISGLITSSTIKIISHKPSYPRIYLNSFETASIKRDEQQLLAMFTFFPFYRFNFQFSRIVRLYPRFVEQFKLHKQRTEAAATQRAIEAAPREKKSKKKNRKKQKLNGNETVTSTLATSVVHDDSNSNYSFSEFYQHPKETGDVFKSPESVNDSPETSFEKAIKAVTQTIVEKEAPKLVKNPFASKLPEFIPLSNDEIVPRAVQIEREPEIVGEARMMMTSDHSKLLMNKKGQSFLSDLQNRLEVIAQFKWDGTGNSMIIVGIPSNQSMFHLEVREYLFRAELAQYEKILEISSNLPKNKARIVHVLKENLHLINRLKTFAVKQTLDSMVSAEKIMDFKKTLKCRKALNIAFVGQAELCEGAQHVGALRRILFILEKDLTQEKFEVTAEMREEITMHMKPIFSHHDYGDYRKLFTQYAKIMKQRHKNKGKLLPNPILN